MTKLLGSQHQNGLFGLSKKLWIDIGVWGILFNKLPCSNSEKNGVLVSKGSICLGSQRLRKKRKEWVKKTSPEIIKLVRQNDTFTPLGDEAYFPQCGTLTYAWAKRGQQPSAKTSGVKKGYKVFG